MSDFLPRDVRDALAAARRGGIDARSGLRVVADGESFPVLRRWKTGFAVAAETAPGLRGLVDLYDGATHLGQCLIVAAGEEEGEQLFEFKRGLVLGDSAPRDFAPEETADPEGAPRPLL